MVEVAVATIVKSSVERVNGSVRPAMSLTRYTRALCFCSLHSLHLSVPVAGLNPFVEPDIGLSKDSESSRFVDSSWYHCERCAQSGFGAGDLESFVFCDMYL